MEGEEYPRVVCFPCLLEIDGAIRGNLEGRWTRERTAVCTSATRHDGRNRLMVLAVVVRWIEMEYGQ